MKLIPIGRGCFAHVDDEDYEYLMQWKWFIGANGYVTRSHYIKGRRQCKFFYMHRVILKPKRHQVVDHKDNNRWNNLKSNIRRCSPSQNLYNRRLTKNNKAGAKGVTIHQRMFRACIKYRGKQIFIGSYRTLKEASLAYQATANKLVGDFASW